LLDIWLGVCAISLEGAWTRVDRRQFSALPDAYKPGYRHSAAFKYAEKGPITEEELRTMSTLGSTGGAAFTRIEEP
jgi:hypothetical protein